MVRKDHVLQEQGFLLGNPQFFGCPGHFLSAHDQMAQQFSLHRIAGDQSQLGKGELCLLGKIMKEGSGQQQAAVQRVGIKTGQEIRNPEHLPCVHQKAGEKTVVHAFGRRDLLESGSMPAQHGLADGTVVRVLDGSHKVFHLFQLLGYIDGGHWDQSFQVIHIVFRCKADLGDGDLKSTPVFRDLAPDFYHFSFLFAVNGAGIVPDLGINGAGFVR